MAHSANEDSSLDLADVISDGKHAVSRACRNLKQSGYANFTGWPGGSESSGGVDEGLVSQQDNELQRGDEACAG